MNSYTASKAKLHFGELLDKSQHEPIEILRNGRPIAVMLSQVEFDRLINAQSTKDQNTEALAKVLNWHEKHKPAFTKEQLDEDPRLAYLVEKHLN